MTARSSLYRILIFGICFLIFSGQLLAANPLAARPDFNRLLDYIEKEDRTEPLTVFGSVEKNFDRLLNLENIAYLNANSELLEQIQSKLNGDHLRWQLNTSFNRLWVVPESRDGYAQLFEQYCRQAIDYLLARIKMPSPYDAIATLKGPLPDPSGKSSGGVTAYLVHNIVDEYVEEYLFFDQDDDSTKIKIKLSNREFDGKIGSYTSKLKIGMDNQFEFIRENFTLWQNSARNPLDVFIVPIEETLHIVLRPSTEQAIQEELEAGWPEKLQQVKDAIDHWMAVEEAVVGGLVSQIMPDLLDHLIHGKLAFSLDQAMAERDAHNQYRFLDQGIDLVNRLGVDETIAFYKDNAKKFKTKLLGMPTKIESAGISQTPVLVN